MIRAAAVALLALVALAAAVFAWWRARLAWKKRRFLHRVNFSLNYVQDNALRFRTLRESDIHDVLLNNDHAVDLVTKAAARTTLDEPVLELPREEAWVVLNSVLNELSEQFAEGFDAQVRLVAQSQYPMSQISSPARPGCAAHRSRQNREPRRSSHRSPRYL